MFTVTSTSSTVPVSVEVAPTMSAVPSPASGMGRFSPAPAKVAVIAPGKAGVLARAADATSQAAAKRAPERRTPGTKQDACRGPPSAGPRAAARRRTRARGARREVAGRSCSSLCRVRDAGPRHSRRVALRRERARGGARRPRRGRWADRRGRARARAGGHGDRCGRARARPRLHRRPHSLRLPALLGPEREPVVVARRHHRGHGQLRLHHRALPARRPRDAAAALAVRRGHAHRDAAGRDRVGLGGLRGLSGRARAPAARGERGAARRALGAAARGARSRGARAGGDRRGAYCARRRRAGGRRGGRGWATSRSPTHCFADDGRPAPSRLADDAELLALAAALRDLDRGVIEVAPRTTIGGFDEKAEEQRFFAALARASGKVVSWAPLLDNPFAPGSAQRLLAEAAALQAAGAAVVPQVGCRPLELRFDFASATFGLDNNAFWRPIMAEPRAARARRFAAPGFRAELAQFEGGFVAALAPGWDRLFVRLPATAEGRRYQDRSVAEIAAERGVPPLDAFCDLVLAEDLATQWGAVILNGDEEAVAALLRDPAGLLALSDAGAHVDTLCDQGFTTHLLGHWVRERGTLALEEAVRLLTDVPARRYGLVGRGRLAPGAAADLVLFDPRRVGARPAEMVYDLPGGQRRLIQRAEGVAYVFVNGTAVVDRGVPTGRGAGRVLRGGA